MTGPTSKKPTAAVPGPALTCQVIDGFADFEALRQDWEALHERDPETSVFLSWQWLAEAFRENLYRWSVIAVLDAGSDQLLGLLPLKYRTHWSRSQQQFQSEIQAAGRLLYSKTTGFLCDPRHEAAVLAALAEKLMQMPWARLSMRYVAQQRRAELFTASFVDRGYELQFKEHLVEGKRTDGLICPQLDLPERFETFLQQLPANSPMRSFPELQRRYLDSGDFQIRRSDSQKGKDGLQQVLNLWQQQQGGQAGAKLAESHRVLLAAAERSNCLFLPVIYQGEQALAALAHVLDWRNGICHFVLAGHSTEDAGAAASLVLQGYCFQWAIRQGFICYDYGPGNQAFKYRDGAQEEQLLYFELRRSQPAAAMAFDSICLGEALRRTHGFLKQGKVDRATRATAQLARLFD